MSTKAKIRLSSAALILVMAASPLIVSITPITRHPLANWTLLVFSLAMALFLSRRILSLTQDIHKEKYDDTVTEYTLKLDQQRETLNHQKETMNQQKEIIASLKQQYSDTLISTQETPSIAQDPMPEPQELPQTKHAYLSQINDKIQAPLHAIISLSKLTLSEQNLSWDITSNLQQIYYNATTILNDMSNLRSLEEADSPPFHPTAYDTPSLIKDIVTLHIPSIQETDITLKLTVDQQLPTVLQGDPLGIKQICHTLLTTILKFIHTGSILLEISWKPHIESIQFKFTLPRVSKDDDNHSIPGNHPSLTLVSRLAAIMYGTLEVEQEHDSPTAYYVTLGQSIISQDPIGKDIAESLTTLSQKSATVEICSRIPFNLSHAHILIVDHNSTNRNVLKKILKPYRLNIHWATSHHQALRQLEAAHPIYDVLLLHHTPPRLDALALARNIRETAGSKHAHTPILLLGEPTCIFEEPPSRTHKHIQEFLYQPIDSMKLDTTLRNLLKEPPPKSILKPRNHPVPKYPW